VRLVKTFISRCSPVVAAAIRSPLSLRLAIALRVVLMIN
jgi:hypothetical protein